MTSRTRQHPSGPQHQTEIVPSTTTSLVLGPSPSSTAIAPKSGDELSNVLAGLDITDDGLSEITAEDIKLPAKIWNFKGLDTEGDPIPPNVFYDTVTEQISRTLELVLMKVHKTNEWREYSQIEGRSRIRCRSFDQVQGTMEDGTIRPCKGCTDFKWMTDGVTDDGRPKPVRRCSPVYNVFAAELENRQPCVLRFKKTSLKSIQDHLNKHHIGKRIVGSQRLDWPLFVFGCKASLKMSADKKYAVPVLERQGILPREDIEQAAATVEYVNSVLLGELDKVIESERDEGEGGDTSFDPNKFASDESKDFVEP